MFMSLELMLNAVNISFISFSHYLQDMRGHIFVFFVITVAAAEAAIGLAIIIALFRNKQTELLYKDLADGSMKTPLGAAAALPVMEGKAVLFKEFANVDAFPICLDTQDPDEIVRWVERHGCDLVAMGTHGHRWLSDMVLGFTATRVQHALSVPVLLLRSK